MKIKKAIIDFLNNKKHVFEDDGLDSNIKKVEEKKKMPKGTWLNMTNAYRESDIDARLNFTEANQKVKL